VDSGVSSHPPFDSSPPGEPDRRRLGLVACVALVLGNIVGIGIFLTPPGVAKASTELWMYVGFWVLGALVAIAGALVYAELGSRFPRAGGEYVFLNKAYGRPVAYAWGWLSALIVFPGSIAALFVWAVSALSSTAVGAWLNDSIVRFDGFTLIWGDVLAVGLVWLTTAFNCRSVTLTSSLQLILTWTPMCIFLLAGAWAIFHTGQLQPVAVPDSVMVSPTLGDFSAAFCKVFWAYAGWNVLVYLGGEIKKPSRTIPGAIVIALAATMVIYVFLNFAFLTAFPLHQLPNMQNVGVATAQRFFGPLGGEVFALVITMAVLAGMNVTTMAGSRISLAMARDGYLWKRMAKTHPSWGTPVTALLVQATLSSILVLTKSADFLITMTGSVMLLLSCVSVSSLFVFRTRNDAPPPYRAFGYPWVPSFFILVGVVVLVAGMTSDGLQMLIGLSVFCGLAGLNLLSSHLRNRRLARTQTS